MKIFKIIQIGDIHYPKIEKTKNFLDKDPGFPDQIKAISSPVPFQAVIRKIKKLVDKGVDAIILNGDLTDVGNEKGYKECLQYLNQNLNICNYEDLSNIHLVPGNHDIKRSLCNDPDGDLYRKFIPFEEITKNNLCEILCVKGPRIKEISNNKNVSICMISINSCIGCGETRSLPEKIRNVLESAIQEYKSAVGPEEADKTLSEELDTPAFAEEDIEEVCININNLDYDIMPVVISHHNILSQIYPKFKVYSEAINAGLVRSRLSTCNKPVLYCHGHIHDSQIEFIHQSNKVNSGLISTSATKIESGFNYIEIYYSYSNKPIGISIIPYVYKHNGEVKKGNEKRIKLCQAIKIEHFGRPELASIKKYLKTEYVRFPNLYQQYCTDTSRIQRRTFADMLLELEWFGLADIRNRTSDHELWQIRKWI